MTQEKYQTLDSGKRDKYGTGAQRDIQENKPRFDLIPAFPLKRVADLYMRGAVKYNDNNWRKGFPWSRVLASLERHIQSWKRGENDEDHLAAVVWNAFALMEYEDIFPELDDINDRKRI